jgi:hypothetical protein
VSTEDEESDDRSTTEDDPVTAEDEPTDDDPVTAEDEPTDDDPVTAEDEPTDDDPVSAEGESTDDDPVSSHWLYISIGLITGIIAWLLIPLFGIGPIYAGYKLYSSESRTISAGIFVVLGTLPLVFWILFLVQAL